jgi:hypothetical protein
VIITDEVTDIHLFIYAVRQHMKAACGNADANFILSPNITSIVFFFNGGFIAF